jgi:hypothetical protein
MRIDQPYGSRFAQGLEPIEPAHKYFIACEGKKTEYQYFEGLIHARMDLGINPLVEVIPVRHSPQTSSHPLSIIRETEEDLQTCEHYFPDVDNVCIIVDRDSGSFFNPQYDEAIELAESLQYRLIISNPCIELWLLLHYTDLSEYCIQTILENKKQGRRTHTEILLKDDYLGGSYNKSRIQFERNFKPYVHSAIENSKYHATTLHQLKEHVGSSIGLLIEEMMEED